MTKTTEKELQLNLDSILTRVQSERLVISRRGKPCAVLVGIEGYDAEDLKLASSPDFWQMIKARRTSGKSLPLAELEARVGITSAKRPGKRAPSRKPRKRLPRD
jgi:prevent-host-death family protein